jgi:hypothetical protein
MVTRHYRWSMSSKQGARWAFHGDPVITILAGILALLAAGLAVFDFLNQELLKGAAWSLLAVAQAALARFTYIRRRDAERRG